MNLILHEIRARANLDKRKHKTPECCSIKLSSENDSELKQSFGRKYLMIVKYEKENDIL